VFASHVSLVTHAPDTQLWLSPHAEHAMPPRPHALSDPPDTHAPLSQHPAQLETPHALSTHLPLLHDWSEPHAVHDAPFVPQLDAVGCVTHSPFLSQQPLQFAGPHGVLMPGVVVASSSDAHPVANKLKPTAIAMA